MLIETKAIVLSAIKFGEADLIVKCFTEVGIKSYMLKRIFRSKSKKVNTAYFQPLSLLQITANHNSRGHLNSIREARAAYMAHDMATDIKKQSTAFFLAEVLSNSLNEEEKNEDLFTFLETSIIWLDTHEKTTNFHLLFMLMLTKYLGFYPELKNKEDLFFDLVEGEFTSRKSLILSLEGQKLELFKSLIGIKFDDIEQLSLNSNHRNVLLEVLLKYYEFHLPNFKKPKSLAVLKEIFR